MSLRDWQNKGWLTEHATSPKEISGLLGVIERDISDSQATGLSPDWRLNIAYNAALQAATIAIYARGFRVSRQFDNRLRYVEAFHKTLGTRESLLLPFDESTR